MAFETKKFWANFLKDADRIRVTRFREQIIEQAYTLRLAAGDAAIDIGAHRARHTIPMAAAVGPKGRVYAIEAAPEMRQKLRAKINRASVPKIRNIVRYCDFAISDHEGESDFHYLPIMGSGLSSLVSPTRIPDDARVVIERVQLRRLDDIVEASDKVGFIKADIEGAEYHAFRGGMALIREKRPMMVFEHRAQADAKRFDYTREDFFGLWRELDYSLVTIFGQEQDEASWGQKFAHDIFALPNERKEEDLAIIHLAILGAAGQLLRAA
jgi:FkbM family methyltransferase